MTSLIRALRLGRLWSYRLAMMGTLLIFAHTGWRLVGSEPSPELPHASPGTSSSQIPVAAPPPVFPSPADLQRLLAPNTPLPSQLLIDPPSPSSAPPDPTIRVFLLVSAGTERSEVLVNGVLLGQTPFVGEISCRRNSQISIAVLPAQGIPLRWTRTCLGQSIRIQ